MLSRLDSWLFEFANIPQELRDQESGLMRQRWFDYRNLLPGQATYLFAEHYEQEYRKMYAETRDSDGAETVKVLLGDDIFKSANGISFWRARQDADRIGCKYDFYIRFVFKRAWDRGWRYIPRPNQIYSEEITLDANAAWSSEKQHSLQLASGGMFKSDSYVGHPDQDAYHIYIVEQIKGRMHHQGILERLVFKEGILPIEVAKQYFSADMLSHAKISSGR